jgi:F420-dependent oxidoreductase-like protein
LRRQRVFEDNREEAGEPDFQVITAQAHAAMTAVPDGDRQPGLAQDPPVIGQGRLRHVHPRGCAGEFACRSKGAHQFETHGVAERMQHRGKVERRGVRLRQPGHDPILAHFDSSGLSNYCGGVIPIGLALSAPGPDGAANTVDALVSQARDAAAAGLASVWLGQMYDFDALTALAAVAVQVPEIALGTAVTVTHTRHPITMSSQAQTVQAASGGRLVLGLGVSHRRPIEQRYGIDFDHPARHMREYLTALRPLLRDGTVAFQGQTLTADTTGFPGHVSGSTPPTVLVAALGPAMLRLAGELADGTVTWMAGPSTIARHIVPAITAAAAGRAPQVAVSLPVCVTSEPDQAHQRAARALAFYSNVPSYRTMLDREAVTSPADIAVIGDERHLAAQLRQLADAGATHFIANTSGVTTPAEHRRTLEALGALAG